MEEGQLGPHSKRGQTGDSPSSYRPICLLDEAGKILERIIVNRLVQHLSWIGPDLNEEYGFRSGRSTVDAILRVRSAVEAEVEDGGVLMAVSLDITNAFNTLPWRWILGAMNHHDMPPYLTSIIRDYFRDRILVYTDRDGMRKRNIECGVP